MTIASGKNGTGNGRGNGPPQLTDEYRNSTAVAAEIARLAMLSLIEYARQREPTARHLGIAVGILDELVGKARGKDDKAGGGDRIELTALSKINGVLTKHIHLDDQGAPVSDGSACVMSHGRAKRVRLADLTAFSALIERLLPHEAIALGALRDDLPDHVNIATKAHVKKLDGGAPPDLIARTADSEERFSLGGAARTICPRGLRAGIRAGE